MQDNIHKQLIVMGLSEIDSVWESGSIFPN